MAAEIDLETLRLIVAVAEVGSLNGAARRVGISQPAASARIREFEARYRVAIVRRTPRGSSLTDDGVAVVSWSRDLLHSADVMTASMKALSQGQTGVKVAASLTVAEHVLPRWMGELHASHPELQPVLRVVNSEAVAALVRDGEVDLGFIESSLMPIDLQRATVGHDRLVVVVGRGHPWAQRSTPVQVAELRTARWVLREPGSGTRSTFEAALRAQPQVAMEGSSTTALVGAAAAGVGPAVVSARSVRAEVETGRLRQVAIDLDLLRPLTAIWRSGERLGAGATHLLAIATRAGS